MFSQMGNHDDVVKSLLKTKADPQLRTDAVPGVIPSANPLKLAREVRASSEQTEDLKLRIHCGNPDCEGEGGSTSMLQNNDKRREYIDGHIAEGRN